MIIGCFALVEPFSPMERQFAAIREMGIEYADLTDNHNGGMLGVEYGFTASFSLDSHPAKIRDLAKKAGITLTSVCAHANLLDATSPDVYGTCEIVKAVRLAHLLGVKQVITTEGEQLVQRPGPLDGADLQRAHAHGVLDELDRPCGHVPSCCMPSIARAVATVCLVRRRIMGASRIR